MKQQQAWVETRKMSWGKKVQWIYFSNSDEYKRSPNLEIATSWIWYPPSEDTLYFRWFTSLAYVSTRPPCREEAASKERKSWRTAIPKIVPSSAVSFKDPAKFLDPNSKLVIFFFFFFLKIVNVWFWILHISSRTFHKGYWNKTFPGLLRKRHKEYHCDSVKR